MLNCHKFHANSENLKSHIKVNTLNTKNILYFMGGMISKTLASFVTYPYQLIRTNQHVKKKIRAIKKFFKFLLIIFFRSIMGIFPLSKF